VHAGASSAESVIGTFHWTFSWLSLGWVLGCGAVASTRGRRGYLDPAAFDQWATGSGAVLKRHSGLHFSGEIKRVMRIGFKVSCN